jgi:hypothetical protein
VIPTLGRPILEECLYWIVAGSAWPGGLIVVDQGSSQQVRAWIEALRSLGIDARHCPHPSVAAPLASTAAWNRSEPASWP